MNDISLLFYHGLFDEPTVGPKVMPPQKRKTDTFSPVRCSWCNGDSLKKMDTATRVQIQDKAVSISHSANTLEKGMNLTILPLATS